jgi:hypothetical protein
VRRAVETCGRASSTCTSARGCTFSETKLPCADAAPPASRRACARSACSSRFRTRTARESSSHPAPSARPAAPAPVLGAGSESSSAATIAASSCRPEAGPETIRAPRAAHSRPLSSSCAPAPPLSRARSPRVHARGGQTARGGAKARRHEGAHSPGAPGRVPGAGGARGSRRQPRRAARGRRARRGGRPRAGRTLAAARRRTVARGSRPPRPAIRAPSPCPARRPRRPRAVRRGRRQRTAALGRRAARGATARGQESVQRRRARVMLRAHASATGATVFYREPAPSAAGDPPRGRAGRGEL